MSLKRGGTLWHSKATAGGLATAMHPILQGTDGIWIGWSGETSGTSDETRNAILKEWADKYRYFAVDLDQETAQGFYEGIANQALWPLFHHFPSLVRFEPEHWKAYVRANETFRDEILKHVRPDDLVWIHDYHFLLLPQMLREVRPDISIGFFLHVPFPVIVCIPDYSEARGVAAGHVGRRFTWPSIHTGTCNISAPRC